MVNVFQRIEFLVMQVRREWLKNGILKSSKNIEIHRARIRYFTNGKNNDDLLDLLESSTCTEQTC